MAFAGTWGNEMVRSLLRSLGTEYGSFAGAVIGAAGTIVAGYFALQGVQQQLNAQSAANRIAYRSFLSTEIDRLEKEKQATLLGSRVFALMGIIQSRSCKINRRVTDSLNSEEFSLSLAQTSLDLGFIKDNLSGPPANDTIRAIVDLTTMRNISAVTFKNKLLYNVAEKVASDICTDFVETDETKHAIGDWIRYIGGRQIGFASEVLKLDQELTSNDCKRLL